MEAASLTMTSGGMVLSLHPEKNQVVVRTATGRKIGNWHIPSYGWTGTTCLHSVSNFQQVVRC